MFIKLTQLNGKPIWFNQAYLVTVEPRKGPGALVVPLGDGLDYEVRESPESIIETMGGASAPAVVHEPCVPVEKVQVAPAPVEEPDFRIDGGLIVPVAANANPEGEVKKKKTTTAKPARKTGTSVQKSTPKTTAKNATKTAAKATSAKATAAKKKKPALPPVPLTEDQLMRLQKMSPGSLRKLVNTLMSQFAVAETSSVVDSLCAHEIISVTDQGHVIWNWRQAEPSLNAT